MTDTTPKKSSKRIIKETVEKKPKLIHRNLDLFEDTIETQLFNLPNHRKGGFANASMVAGLIPWFEPNKKMVVRDGDTPAKLLDADPIYFEVDDLQCSIVRRAAVITLRHGKNKGQKVVRFPSEREFDVLEALMLIGTHETGAIGAYQGQSSVRFTLTIVRRHLKNKYNNDEIQEALDVLGGAKHTLRIKSEDRLIEMPDSILPITISGDQVTGESMELNLDTATHLVVLHPLITSAISNLDMHQVHSSAVIESNSLLVRYLRKRLALRWTQASPSAPYRIKASTILTNYGYNPATASKKHFKLTARPVTRALETLSTGDNRIIESVITENIMSASTGRNKIVDYIYTIFPVASFVEHQKRSLALSTKKHSLVKDAKALGVRVDQLKP
jgi:uncharacterized membrane protein YpjA